MIGFLCFQSAYLLFMYFFFALTWTPRALSRTIAESCRLFLHHRRLDMITYEIFSIYDFPTQSKFLAISRFCWDAVNIVFIVSHSPKLFRFWFDKTNSGTARQHQRDIDDRATVRFWNVQIVYLSQRWLAGLMCDLFRLQSLLYCTSPNLSLLIFPISNEKKKASTDDYN